NGQIVKTGFDDPPEVSDQLACPEGVIEPGRVNAHTHIYSALAPFGMPAPEPAPENFVQILERVWWRLDRAIDEASLRASARYYVAKSLLAGTTGLIDHHESPGLVTGSLDAIADACAQLGTRALLCYGATERNGGLEEGRAGLDECVRFIRSGETATVRGVIGLHASFTVSDEIVRKTAALCDEVGRPLHIHLAEDGADVADALNRGYAGPLERLIDLGALPTGSILAHGVHLSEEQVDAASAAGAWFVQNPRSNENNKVGYPAHYARRSNVALGTDGFPADMREELAALNRIGAEFGEEAADLGARARTSRTMLASQFGCSLELEPGGRADLIISQSEHVLHVIVDGNHVVRHGQLVNGDIGEIEELARAEAKSLWHRMNLL
ncbi:MAG: amidohydrolase family protein, partial [Myxococcales bacterium]|nr:amidohydrolase family protein [Myxococcales bacterium]